MQIINTLFDIFIFRIMLTSMSCFKYFLKLRISYSLNLFYILLQGWQESMYIYQATNTLLKSYNQLQSKNIHINFFIFSLW